MFADPFDDIDLVFCSACTSTTNSPVRFASMWVPRNTRNFPRSTCFPTFCNLASTPAKSLSIQPGSSPTSGFRGIIADCRMPRFGCSMVAAEHFHADYVLAAVRAEHQAFYRRVNQHDGVRTAAISAAAKPIGLMTVDYPASRAGAALSVISSTLSSGAAVRACAGPVADANTSTLGPSDWRGGPLRLVEDDTPASRVSCPRVCAIGDRSDSRGPRCDRKRSHSKRPRSRGRNVRASRKGRKRFSERSYSTKVRAPIDLI